MADERVFRTTIVDVRKISDKTVAVTEFVEEVKPYANRSFAEYLRGVRPTHVRMCFPFKPENLK